jgi:undecaprenyl-diphosphatase
VTLATVKSTAARDMSRPQWIRANIAAFVALLRRPSRLRAATRFAWRAPLRLAAGAVLAVAAVVAAMIVADAWAIAQIPRLPPWLVDAFDAVTDFGKAGWLLVPAGCLLVVIAVFAAPTLPRLSRLVLAAVSVRLGFIFLAIGLPGLFVTIVKRIIGRARPLVEGGIDPFLYRPFGWSVEYASLPSGHAANVGAAAIALGALWPRARPLLWSYALVIMVSRVVVAAHYPSDVLAGVMVGVLGALLVRDAFAARRLGFVPDGSGGVQALPGPSLSRIKRVARQLLAQ